MGEDASKKADIPLEEASALQDVAKARKARAAAIGKIAPDVKAVAEMRAVPAEARTSVPAVEDEKTKVIHIVRRLQEEANRQRRRKKKPWLLLSILAAIVLPTVIASLYYIFIASDRYLSEARFAVRSNQPQVSDMLGVIAGMPATTTISDSYIVVDYIGSRDMVQELERRVPLREIYSSPKADYLSRLTADATLEGVVKYWNKHVDVYFDPIKNTISVQVDAFSAEEAERVAQEVVDIVRNLVNDLSARARRDAVQFAAAELARAELRVRDARDSMLQFRLVHNELDPIESAKATFGTVLPELQGQRSALASHLAAIQPYLGEDAPSVQMTKSKIAAIDKEIDRVQSKVSKGRDNEPPDAALRATVDGESTGEPAMASVVGKYTELLLDQEFAEKSYVAAEASLERARVDAERQQSYLALFVQPQLADAAAYPRRVVAILVVLVMASILWAIGGLGFLTVRDHMF